MIRANLLNFGSLPSYRIGLETYDQDKLGLGELISQRTGPLQDDKFVGPTPISVLRPMEMSTPGAFSFPWAMQWSFSATSEIDWEFYADNSSAGATRKILMATNNRKTGVRTTSGFITLTFPGTTENKVIRTFRMKYKKAINGTVAVAGTAVTGTGTTFLAKACVGNRIGFGSTNSAAISTWYEIASITNDGALVLTTTAGTIAAGTSYVIENLQALVAVTSTTIANGGLYLVKGLRPEIFTPAGITIPAATTVNNIRAVYFLNDAVTGTNTVSIGLGMEDELSDTQHFVWVLDTLANPVLFKFNINASLVLTAGKDTSSFVLKSGAGGVLTGAPSQLNNARVVTAAHGPGAGIPCIYFTTATRVYRTINVNSITSGSTAWLADNMTEVPPGGVNTIAVSNTIQAIEYAATMDSFVIMTAGAGGVRSYLAKYNTSGAQFDRLLFIENRQQDQGAADASLTPIPTIMSTSFSVWVEDGMMYAARNGTTAVLNQIYAIPISADWEYASSTNNRLIFPRIQCIDCQKYNNVFVNAVQVVGGASGKNLGLNPEPYRLFFRTVGISDNSGSWTVIPSNGDLGSVAGASHIQFMAEFRVMNTMLPARLQSLAVVYTDNNNDDHFMSSTTASDVAIKRFAWYFATPFGSTVPNLRVNLYNADTGGLLLTDTTTGTSSGTFEKAVNGTEGGWAAYTNADRSTANTYISYTPTSLADNIKVRAVLSLA
jgi:hypothetical protein